MANIVQIQDDLKNVSDQNLVDFVKRPTGQVPSYLALGEIKRRKETRDKYQGEKAQQKTTVADDLVAAQGIGNQMTQNPMSQPTAGVGTPQPQEPINPAMLASKGIGQLNPGAVKQMNDGGIVGFVGGGEPGEKLRKVQAQNRKIPYGLENFFGTDILDDTMSNFKRYGDIKEKFTEQEIVGAGTEYPTSLRKTPEDLVKQQIIEDQKEQVDSSLGGGYMPSEQDSIDSAIALQTSINEKEAEETNKLQQANNIEDLVVDKKFKINQALLDSAGGANTDFEGANTDFEGAKLDTGILDMSVYEETNPILKGDEAMEAYERRVGVSPFVALAGKYEQEIGENIAENKKQSFGKFLFNFGSELATSGQLGKAAKAGGKDFEKDMDRLTALKREQRKVNFDIAKITDMERMTKGKLGADVEAREKLMNNKRKLQKNADILKRDENEYKKKYYDKLGIKAESEAKYLNQFDPAKKGALVSSFDLATKTIFGDENGYKKWKNRDDKIKAYQENNNISYTQAAAEVLKSFPANEATEHIKLGKDFTQAQVSFYDRLSPKAIPGAPNNIPVGLNPRTNLKPDPLSIR